MMRQILLDSAYFPVRQRLVTDSVTMRGFQVEALDDPAGFAARATTTFVGPLTITEEWVGPARYQRDFDRIVADGLDHFTIFMPFDIPVSGVADRAPMIVPPGGVLVIDLTRTMLLETPGGHFITLTIPRPFLEGVLLGISLHGPVDEAPALVLAIGWLRSALAAASALPNEAGDLYAQVLRDLFAAALLPTYRTEALDEPRMRRLLNKVTSYIDGNLTNPLDANIIGRALGLSRSSLYRATQAVNGVSELIRRRRLIAAHRLLSVPDDDRTILIIAGEAGFTDQAQFSRLFRRHFGYTAGSVRSRHRRSTTMVTDDDQSLLLQPLQSIVAPHDPVS